jgi:hypothetical protein
LSAGIQMMMGVTRYLGPVAGPFVLFNVGGSGGRWKPRRSCTAYFDIEQNGSFCLIDTAQNCQHFQLKCKSMIIFSLAEFP